MSTQTTMPPVRRTVTVRQPLDRAFALFTARIDEWWPQGGALAGSTGSVPGTVVLEARPEGRIYRRHADGSIEFCGEVRAWEPPHRIVLGWQPAPGSSVTTEVEVRFTAEEPGTRVELEHRGWDQLGGDAATARADYDSAWGEALRQYAAAGQDNGPAVAALILGITSVVLPVLGVLAAPFAIAFGIVGRRRARAGGPSGGVATAGLTLGAIGLVLWGLLLALGLTLVSQSGGEDEQVPVEPVPTSQSAR